MVDLCCLFRAALVYIPVDVLNRCKLPPGALLAVLLLCRDFLMRGGGDLVATCVCG